MSIDVAFVDASTATLTSSSQFVGGVVHMRAAVAGVLF